jgi:hypothetical protein
MRILESSKDFKGIHDSNAHCPILAAIVVAAQQAQTGVG